MAGDKRTAEDLGAWLVFEDESGQGLRLPKGRTWGRSGQTPVVTVTGGSNKRKGFTEADYARLLDAAHQQLGGPLVLVWDNLNTHVSKAMRELVAGRDWLMVIQLPPTPPSSTR